jgi:hypothetical protein
VLGFIGLLFPGLLPAQAWLPEKGDLSWAVVYSDILNKKHYLPDGDEVDVGHTTTQSIGLLAAYGLTDRFTIEAALPYVRAKYEGGRPHPTEIDDGHYHKTLTDLRVGLHFQALEEPFAFAPYVAFVTPVTDYETMGHAAPGRGLNEAWVGFYAGKSLDEWIPGVYVQGRYNYAFVEKVAGVSHDRSNADLELGYFITPEWSVRALGAWQETYGGIDVPVPVTHPLFQYHDQLAAESFVHLGGGVGWSFSERVDLYLIYTTSISGTNGHKLDRGFTVGIGYNIPAK